MEKPGRARTHCGYLVDDYSDGPVERENLAESRPEVVKELAALLAKHPAPVHATSLARHKSDPLNRDVRLRSRVPACNGRQNTDGAIMALWGRPFCPR